MRTSNVNTSVPQRTLVSDLWRDMERLLETNFFTDTNEAVYDERSFGLACDVTEAAHGFLLSMDVPGMKLEEIKIEVTDNVLVISGERKRDPKIFDSQRSLRQEKPYGYFQRNFTLPKTVDSEKIEAFYQNGVLELFVPKLETAKPRSIQIQSKKKACLKNYSTYRTNSESPTKFIDPLYPRQAPLPEELGAPALTDLETIYSG